MPKSLAEEFHDSLDELYDFNQRFFTSMARMKKVLTPEVRASLNSQDLIDLEVMLAPLQKFDNFLLRTPGLNEKDTVKEIASQFDSKAFEANKAAFLEVRKNHVAFSGFLARLQAKGVNPNVIKVLRDNYIYPIQNFNRYELHMKVMRKAYAEYQGIDLKDFQEFKATEKKGSLMQFNAFQNKYPNADVRTLISLDKILIMHSALQDQSNKTENYELFELSPKERSNLHKELIASNQQTTLKSMTAQLEEIGKMMADATPTANEKLRAVMLTFCDAYIDERSKSFLGGTKHSPFLENILTRIIKEFKIDVSGGKKTDEAVFEFAGKTPQVINALVAHLYERATIEGMSGVKDQAVFINAVKAVVRMGNDAIKVWNQLVVKNSQQDDNVLILPPNTTEKGKVVRGIKENKIEALFHAKLEKMPKEAVTRLQPSLLVDSFAQAQQPDDMSQAQYEKFQVIATAMQRASRSKDPTEVHKVFMKAYFDTYILERTKVGMHSQPGKLQSFLESLATDSDSHADTALFKTVPKDSVEAMDLALRAHALMTTNNSLQNKSQFVNILKAVVRMGIERQWNDLVSVNERGLMLTGKTDTSEKGFEKLWDAVKDNPNEPLTPTSRTAKPSISTRLSTFGLLGKGGDHTPSPRSDSPEAKSPRQTPKK